MSVRLSVRWERYGEKKFSVSFEVRGQLLFIYDLRATDNNMRY